VDIAPTITSLLGFASGDGWQGQNLFDDDFDHNLATSLGIAEGPEGAAGSTPTEAPPPGTPPALGTPPGTPAGMSVAEATNPPKAPLSWDQNPASREAVSEQNFEGYDLESLRGNGFKLIQVEAIPSSGSRFTKGDHLFDLTTDPGEQHELQGTGNVHQGQMDDGLQHSLEAIRSGKAQSVNTEQSCAEIDKLISLGYLTEDGRPERCKTEQK
jgi:arylsulfatase A-like enzyme